MAPIAGDWQEALKGEFHQPYYAKLYKTVMTEYRTRKIFSAAGRYVQCVSFYASASGKGCDPGTGPLSQ